MAWVRKVYGRWRSVMAPAVAWVAKIGILYSSASVWTARVTELWYWPITAETRSWVASLRKAANPFSGVPESSSTTNSIFRPSRSPLRALMSSAAIFAPRTMNCPPLASPGGESGVKTPIFTGAWAEAAVVTPISNRAAETQAARLRFIQGLLSDSLENVHAALSVHEIDQPLARQEYIVARRALEALRRIGDEVRDLPRGMGILDVHDAKPVREPGHEDLRAVYLLGRLMASREFRLRHVVDPRHLEGRDGDGIRFDGDVDDPHERRRRGTELPHILVGDHEKPASRDRKRDGQRGVGRMRVGRAPVEMRHHARLAQVVDVQDHEPGVPVSDVETIDEAQRVMTPGFSVPPGRRLPARRPLAGHPPAADLLGTAGVLQVEDHDDVAEIAVDLGGDVGIAPVEVVAVQAGARGLPEGDRTWLGRLRYVVDGEPAPESRLELVGWGGLPIDQHEVVHHADLMGVNTGRHLEGGDLARAIRILDVNDGGSVGTFHVGDVRVALVDEDLTAPRAVEVANLPQSFDPGHQGSLGDDTAPISANPSGSR